jgi:hypothetical protein
VGGGEGANNAFQNDISLLRLSSYSSIGIFTLFSQP